MSSPETLKCATCGTKTILMFMYHLASVRCECPDLLAEVDRRWAEWKDMCATTKAAPFSDEGQNT